MSYQYSYGSVGLPRVLEYSAEHSTPKLLVSGSPVDGRSSIGNTADVGGRVGKYGNGITHSLLTDRNSENSHTSAFLAPEY